MGCGSSTDNKVYAVDSQPKPREVVQEQLAVTASPTGKCVLRIIAINDVYELDNFPHFSTARKLESAGANLTIATLNGDFVAPSLLSSLDKGHGMVDCMNIAGIDYVCFGNHENDIPLNQLHNRIKESKFTWINSNMQSLPLPPDIGCLPDRVIIEVKSDDASSIRKVALLGLNTEDPSIYPPGAFGGCKIEPLNETAVRMYKTVTEENAVDAVIPMTHQYIPQDRTLAKMKVGFPLLLGGHDHELYYEVVEGCHIVKTGMDGSTIAIIDVTWADSSSTKPEITVVMKESKSYARDPILEEAIERHKQVLKSLETAVLCPMPQTVSLSSRGIRLKPTTMGTFLMSTLRNVLGAEVAMFCGGNIRADRDYEGEKYFTYAHLKAEIAFETAVAVVKLPGAVIAEAITYSRSFALQTPPVVKGCYMQTDDGITWDRSTNTVLTIAREPVDPERLYTVALNPQVMEGVDNVAPVVNYVKGRPDDPDVHPHAELAMEFKHILVGYFAKLTIFDIVTSSDFGSLDADGDGFLTREDFVRAAKAKNWSTMNDMQLNNLFAVATNGDDATRISKRDVLALAMEVHDKIEYVPKSDKDWVTIDELKAEAHKILGRAYDDQVVEAVFKELDVDGSGHVSHGEIVSWLVSKKDVGHVVI